MKKTYENFLEIGEHFVEGETWTHILSNHTPDECYAWMHGVQEFAHWLDEMGLEIVQNPEIYDKLWDSGRKYKPRKNPMHPKE